MPEPSNYLTLPKDLPVPANDGACDHLAGTRVSNITLRSTRGIHVCPARIAGQRVVIYCYPFSGRPGEALPVGWDQVPGARGCTPQACGFRDNYQALQAAGAVVFGLSTQSTEYQRELVQRLHLPFDMLSDADLRFASALRLPTFTAGGMVLIKRLTLVVHLGIIEKVFYPVFPPDRHASEVLEWLSNAKA